MNSMPVLFVGHGSPMNIVENNRFTQGWAAIAQKIPRPQSILCISAHWYGSEAVSSTHAPDTIHDFYGFPQELYHVEYPAPGAPDLADRVVDLFNGSIGVDPQRGLDHGAWSVLRFMYPEADIPVCQLSVSATHTPLESYKAGQRLRVLRKEGVLILGSGNIVHNLSLVGWDMAGGYGWADVFDAYIENALKKNRHDNVINYHKAGLASQKAVYYRDHFDPLLYVLGAAGADPVLQVFNNERVLGSVSMTSYLIGD